MALSNLSVLQDELRKKMLEYELLVAQERAILRATQSRYNKSAAASIQNHNQSQSICSSSSISSSTSTSTTASTSSSSGGANNTDLRLIWCHNQGGYNNFSTSTPAVKQKESSAGTLATGTRRNTPKTSTASTLSSKSGTSSGFGTQSSISTGTRNNTRASSNASSCGNGPHLTRARTNNNNSTTITITTPSESTRSSIKSLHNDCVDSSQSSPTASLCVSPAVANSLATDPIDTPQLLNKLKVLSHSPSISSTYSLSQSHLWELPPPPSTLFNNSSSSQSADLNMPDLENEKLSQNDNIIIDKINLHNNNNDDIYGNIDLAENKCDSQQEEKFQIYRSHVSRNDSENEKLSNIKIIDRAYTSKKSTLTPTTNMRRANTTTTSRSIPLSEDLNKRTRLHKILHHSSNSTANLNNHAARGLQSRDFHPSKTFDMQNTTNENSMMDRKSQLCSGDSTASITSTKTITFGSKPTLAQLKHQRIQSRLSICCRSCYLPHHRCRCLSNNGINHDHSEPKNCALETGH